MLEPGLALTREYDVERSMTAAALAERDNPGGGALPEVWSTPDMIGKMEIVAAALVEGHLAPGQITVGARNEIDHLAATPVGFRVRVGATLSAVDGRKLIFAVEAHDGKEKVGEGVHVRFIVDAAKFDARLQQKRA